MKEPTMRIRIGELPEIDFLMQVELDSSWQQLTDFGTLVLPRNIRTLSGKDIARLIQRGNKIEIDLGYDGENETEFVGYVTDVTAGYPLTINFEDSMFQLKKNPINISGNSISLEELIRKILPEGMPFEAIEMEIGAYRYSKVTAAQVLQQLQRERGIYSWFRNEKLHGGFAYDLQDHRRISCNFEDVDGEAPIKDSSSSLQYRFADTLNVKVNAISILPDNTRIELSIGDNDGETRTLHFYNIKTESALRRVAEEELKRLRFDGWRGKFRSFGFPRAKHGDIVTITDPDFPEFKRGTHFIDRVKTFSGTNGYFRDITPGRIAL